MPTLLGGSGFLLPVFAALHNLAGVVGRIARCQRRAPAEAAADRLLVLGACRRKGPAMLAVALTAAVLALGAGGPAGADSEAELKAASAQFAACFERNLVALRAARPVLVEFGGPLDNRTLVELDWTIHNAERALAFVRRGLNGVTCSPGEVAYVHGAFEASDPNRLVTRLLDFNDSHVADPDPVLHTVPVPVIEVIGAMPGVVTVDAVGLAKRLMDKEAVELAELVARRNNEHPGHAPADLLPLIVQGREYAADVWSGKAVAPLAK